MRKFTSLLMLFFAVVSTAFAQTLPATDKAFTVIAEGHNSGVKPGWAINNEGTKMVSFGNTSIADEAQKKFAFVQYDGKVYLYSVWAQKFVQKDMTLSTSLPIDDIKVENVDGGKFYFKYDDTHNMNIGGSKQLAPDGWNTKDGGNQYTLTVVEDFDPTAAIQILSASYVITYNFKYEGNTVATQVTSISVGDNYPAITVLPWGASATVPEGKPTSNETVDIDCTVDTSVLPFVPAASYDEITNWYYLEFDSKNKFYLYHHDGTRLNLNKTAVEQNNKYNYTWAFVGNPFTGYQIVNFGKGKGYVLSSSTTMSGSSGSDTWPIMTQTPVPNGNNEYWIPTESDKAENGFFLAQKGHANNRLNNRDSKLAYWTGGADEGSTFRVVECDYNVAGIKILNDAKALIAAVDADQNKTVGQYKTSALFNLALAIEQYEAAPTDELLNSVVAEYENVLANGVKVTLEAGDKFTVKQIDNRGYMVYSAVEGKGSEENVYLAGSNRTDYHPALDAEGVYKYWAIYERDGKKYIYNTENNKFISVNGAVVKFVGTPSEISVQDLGNQVTAIYFNESNNYLEFSPGYNDVAVRTINNCNGVGAQFVIIKEGTVDSQEEIEKEFDAIPLNNWKKQALATLGYVGCYPVEKESEINALSSMSEVATFEETYADTKIQLGEGYYFLRGTGEGNNATWYITYGDNGTDFVAKSLASGEKLGTKHVWYFHDVQDEDTYKLKSVNLDKYVTTAAAPGTSQITSSYGSGFSYAFADNGNGKFTITDGNGSVLRTENGGQLNQWGSEKDETWYVIPAVELEITLGAEYGTIHLPFDVTLPAEGLKAYAVTAVSDTHATLEEKADVKANEGVILQGQGTHKLTIATASSDWTENMLAGSNVNTYVADNAYVLANGVDGIGLYKAALNKNENGEEGTTHFLNNANKAYLPVVNLGVNALRFNFDGETTAIETVEVENTNAPIYDLSGRRVLSTVKGGIYIQNGKKFIVK